MAFQELLADLQVLAKSAGTEADDANIQAAGATGGDSGDGGEGAAGAGAGGEGGEGGDTVTGAGGEDTLAGAGEGSLAKSFKVTLEDGTEFEAMDAGEMLKSMGARMDDVETSTGEALTLCVTMIKSLVAENGKLTEAVRKIAGTGAGRTAVLSIVGKTGATAAGAATLTKSNDVAMKPQEFLAKASNAYDAQALTSRELGYIETLINRSEPIPAALISKVMAATGAVA